MAQHPTVSDSIATHIENQNHAAGALEYSPGNHDLLTPVEKSLGELKTVLGAQNQASDLAQRLAGGMALVLMLLEPLVRELEKAFKAYLASPPGKDKPSIFVATASDILTKFNHEDRDAALVKLDAAVTRPDCPAGLKDVGKRFHEMHTKLVTLRGLGGKNTVKKETNAANALQAKHGSTAASQQLEGHLQARRPGEPAYVDAHFKPAPKRAKKPDEKKGEDKKTEDKKTDDKKIDDKKIEETPAPPPDVKVA